MSPKTKAGKMKTLTSKKSVPKIKKITPKKPSSTKTKSTSGAVTKIPKNTKKAEPSASTILCTRIEENEDYFDIVEDLFEDDILIIPTNKKNLPEIENKIQVQCEPGAAYANIFMDIPGIGISDIEEYEEPKKKVKTKKKCPGERGRKKSVGYKSVPLPGECLLTNYAEPGAAYANIFMNIPIDISDIEEDEEPKKKVQTKRKCPGKRGRKKSVGYKGVPLSDECLLTNYAELFKSLE